MNITANTSFDANIAVTTPRESARAPSGAAAPHSVDERQRLAIDPQHDPSQSHKLAKPDINALHFTFIRLSARLAAIPDTA